VDYFIRGVQRDQQLGVLTRETRQAWQQPFEREGIGCADAEPNPAFLLAQIAQSGLQADEKFPHDGRQRGPRCREA